MPKKNKIPEKLEECFDELDKIDFLNGSFDSDEDTFVAKHHFTLGRWIRNEWGLWDEKINGKLKKHFINKGVHHPDDISAIILKSYYRYLKNEDLKIEEQVDYYLEYYMDKSEIEKYRRKKKLNKLNE